MCGLKDETMTETDFKNLYSFPANSSDCKKTSVEAFIIIDIGDMGERFGPVSAQKITNLFTLIHSVGMPIFLLQNRPNLLTVHICFSS